MRQTLTPRLIAMTRARAASHDRRVGAAVMLWNLRARTELDDERLALGGSHADGRPRGPLRSGPEQRCPRGAPAPAPEHQHRSDHLLPEYRKTRLALPPIEVPA